MICRVCTKDRIPLTVGLCWPCINHLIQLLATKWAMADPLEDSMIDFLKWVEEKTKT